MKRLSMLLSAALLASSILFAGCGSSEGAHSATGEAGEETASEPEMSREELLGGYTLDPALGTQNIPEAAQTAFNKAKEGYTGAGFKTVALLGTQVVSGTNYEILCKMIRGEDEANAILAVVIVYEDLEGNAEITNISRFPLAKYAGESITLQDEQLAGGWQVNCEASDPGIAGEAQTAFYEATDGLLGATYEPIAVLGSQVVNGTNYAILCFETVVAEQEQYCMCVATINKNSNGISGLSSVAEIDLASFNQ